MPNISMCSNWMCRKRNHCHRFLATPSKPYQSYSDYGPDANGNCDAYMKENFHKLKFTELKTRDKFHIQGRGDAFLVYVEDNPGTSYSIFKAMQNNADLVKIEGKMYTIEGIEKFAVAKPETLKEFGLLVKNI